MSLDGELIPRVMVCNDARLFERAHVSPPMDACVAVGIGQERQCVRVTQFWHAKAYELSSSEFVNAAQQMCLLALCKPELVMAYGMALRECASGLYGFERIAPFGAASAINASSGQARNVFVQTESVEIHNHLSLSFWGGGLDGPMMCGWKIQERAAIMRL